MSDIGRIAHVKYLQVSKLQEQLMTARDEAARLRVRGSLTWVFRNPLIKTFLLCGLLKIEKIPHKCTSVCPVLGRAEVFQREGKITTF